MVDALPDSLPTNRLRRASQIPAVVLGADSNALGFFRSLGRKGIPVLGLENQWHPGMLSRFCHPILSPDPVLREDDALRFLQELGHAIGGRSVLLPTTDAFVTFVANHRSELQDTYEFNVSDVVHSLTDKGQQYRLAAGLGIPTPRTAFPGEQDVEEIAADMEYPCILKPCQSHLWLRFVGTHSTKSWGKAIEVHSGSELVQTYREVSRSGLPFMVQETIPGRDDQLFGLFTYLDRTSQPLAVLTKRKLRQSPRGYGVGSIHVSVRVPEVAELGLRLLQGLKFSGLAGVEFKRDARDGKFKLIEINPRSIAITQQAVVCGVDIPFVAYRDCLGERVEPNSSFREGVKWINVPKDLASFPEYHRAEGLDLITYVQSWRGPRCFAYFVWDDPLPGLAYMNRFVNLMVRKWVRARGS